MSKHLPRAYESVKSYLATDFSFGGLDLNPGARDGKIKSAVNMTLDRFPVMSPREPRGIYLSFGQRTVYGAGFSKRFFCCAENDLGEAYFYYDGEAIFPVSSTEKTFAVINGFILVFPDKKYFSETSFEAKNVSEPYSDIEALHDAVSGIKDLEAGDIYIAGTGVFSYNPSGVWKNNLTQAGDANPTPYAYQAQTEWTYLSEVWGSLELSESFGERKDGKLIMTKSEDTGGYDTIADWDSGDRLHPLRAGDAVTLKVRFRSSDTPHTYIYKSYDAILTRVYVSGSLYRYVFSGISVPEYLDSDGNDTPVSGKYTRYSATVIRKVPDFDVVFSHNNRIWGAQKGRIHASALGDPFNFNGFTASASGAWSLESGFKGNFTGGRSFLGYPVFFKEDAIIKIAGDYPAEYVTLETRDVPGVRSGAEKSLCSAGGYLFYASADGIYAYTGSFPFKVSDALFDLDLTGAKAGADSGKAYFSVPDGLYVYDISKGTWMCEDKSPFSFFSESEGVLYALRESDNVFYSLSGENYLERESESVYSYAVTAPIYDESLEKKGAGRLNVSVTLRENSWVALYISYDGGGYKKLFQIEKSGVYTVPVVLKRCSYYSIMIKGEGHYEIMSLSRRVVK